MTNVIVKDGIVIHTTDDEITLPQSDQMIEFTPFDEQYNIHVGGGDVNTNNCSLYTSVTLPEDYVNLKYSYDGSWQINPDYEA